MTFYKRALLKRFKTKYAPDEVDKLAVLIIISFLTIFSIMGCISAYAVEETIEPVSASYWASGSGVLETNTSALGYYFPIEAGHSYTIDFSMTNNVEYLRTMFTTSAPDEGVQVYDFHSLSQGATSYTFNAIDNGYLYFYIYTYNYNNNVLTINSVTDVTNVYENSVSSLVDNVGVNQIWDVFGSGINFIYVVVIVALGIFLIALAIRKVSKGKSEF